MKQPLKIIVVGGNAAGPAAAAKAKRVNPSAQVSLFETGDFISTGTCEMPYVLSGDIKNYEEIIFNTPETFLAKKGVRVFINHSVQEINRKDKTVSVFDAQTKQVKKFSYDRLILTTGSVASSLPGFTNDLENVFSLKSIKDLISIKKYIDANKINHATIIGAGYIGLETADALYAIGSKITIIESKELPLPHGEIEISRKVREDIGKSSMRLITGNTKLEPIVIDNRVVSLQCDNDVVETDIVILAIGISPNNSLAINAKLETGKYGGLRVDRNLRTSDRSIFAAGDNIEMINAVTGKPDYLPFSTYAHLYGHIAGENASGGNVLAAPVIKNVSLKFLDNFIASVGLSSNYKEDVRFRPTFISAEVPGLVPVMPGSKKVFGKLVFDSENKKILGASFYGGREVSGYSDLISSAILSEQKIEFLTRINYNYTPPLSPFINLLSVLGRKALKSSTK